MKQWQEEYRRKLISAEEASRLVKSGDYVTFTLGREASTVARAIASRKEELRGVKVMVPSPMYDFGWYAPGWEESFSITLGLPTTISQQMLEERRCDMLPSGLIPLQYLPFGVPDVLLTEVSPPDERGFCSFGNAAWNKKRQIREAKLVIAEVNNRLIRPYGDTQVHVSEIDYFVEHIPTGRMPGVGDLAGRGVKEPEPYLKPIMENVRELIRDGDTIQIGIGRTTEPMVRLGLFDGKHDLGYHSEATPPGVISLVKEGIINGKYKTENPDKCVCTSLGGGTREEMEWADHNPLFELVDVGYLEDIRVIAAHDNMVVINQALAVDLSGQISAESLGTRIVSGAGGQIPFVIGALLSKGGKAITVLPSTARNGTVSRIMPLLPEGTMVTIQQHCADYIVTEYGVAHLKGKTRRQRAEELIAIAHPNFRVELRKEAQKLLWP